MKKLPEANRVNVVHLWNFGALPARLLHRLRVVPTVALTALTAVALIGWTALAAQDAPAPKAKPAAEAKPPKDAPQPNQVNEFMRAKLLHSQKVLEGLATEDFDQIAKHAQEMSLLSQAATWQVLQTPEYRDRSTEFRRAVDAVTEAARKKNLDAAALAYVDVTMKCVSCHKYVRHVRMVLRKPAESGKVVGLTGERPIEFAAE